MRWSPSNVIRNLNGELCFGTKLKENKQTSKETETQTKLTAFDVEARPCCLTVKHPSAPLPDHQAARRAGLQHPKNDTERCSHTFRTLNHDRNELRS